MSEVSVAWNIMEGPENNRPLGIKLFPTYELASHLFWIAQLCSPLLLCPRMHIMQMSGIAQTFIISQFDTHWKCKWKHLEKLEVHTVTLHIWPTEVTVCYIHHLQTPFQIIYCDIRRCNSENLDIIDIADIRLFFFLCWGNIGLYS